MRMGTLSISFKIQFSKTATLSDFVGTLQQTDDSLQVSINFSEFKPEELKVLLVTIFPFIHISIVWSWMGSSIKESRKFLEVSNFQVSVIGEWIVVDAQHSERSDHLGIVERSVPKNLKNSVISSAPTVALSCVENMGTFPVEIRKIQLTFFIVVSCSVGGPRPSLYPLLSLQNKILMSYDFP